METVSRRRKFYQLKRHLSREWRRQWPPLQSSCPENPVDGGAWWAAVHGVAKSRTRLSDFTFTFHFHALEKEMATHSSVLAWRIPGTGEPGGLPSMGSHRVRHDWSDSSAAAAAREYMYKWLYIEHNVRRRKLPKTSFHSQCLCYFGDPEMITENLATCINR